MRPVAFYHCYQRYTWVDITKELFAHFARPGCEAFKTVLVSLIGTESFRPILETWGEPCVISRMVGGGELVTLSLIWNYAKENDGPVFYFHTKGVTKPGLERHMKGWRDLMMYFLVEQTPECLELLEQGKDVVGVDYRREKNEIESRRHYAGNFWWTTCKHLRTLTQPLAEPELWVCSRRGGIYHCLHESANDHYRKVYPAEAYR